MPSISDLDSTQIVDALGAQVRIDFVKESNRQPLFGNLYTQDPESNSVVVAQFSVGEKVTTEPTKLLLIPGTSIQNVQILDAEQTTSSSEDTTSRQLPYGIGNSMAPNTPELRTLFEQMFHQNEAENGTQPETSNKSNQNAPAEQMETRKRERTPFESMKIIEEFVQAKRCRLIDALNKKRIKFHEKPYLLPLPLLGAGEKGNNKEAVEIREESDNGLSVPTVLLITSGSGSGCRVVPPYGKTNIYGKAKPVRDLTLMLDEENFFHDEKCAAEQHFIGC